MKKRLCVFALILTMALSFSGCGMFVFDVPSETELPTQQETEFKTQAETEAVIATEPTEPTEPETGPETRPSGIAYLQKTGYVDGKFCYTNDRKWTYFENSVVSALPDNIKDKIGSFFVVDDYIYYMPMVGGSGGFAVELRRMHTDGSDNELIVDDYSYGGEFQYSNGRIMYDCFDDAQSRYGMMIVDVDTKDSFYFKDIHNGVLHNGTTLYYYDGIILRSMDIETGDIKDVFTEEGNIFSYDGSYIYYTTDNGSLKRYNIATNEREFIDNIFGSIYAVANNTVYWVSPGNNTAKIFAYDISSKTDTLIAEVDSVNGIHRLAAENGYLIYTVAKYNDMGDNASDYILDLNTGTATLVCDYHVAQF